jgi:DNA-binding MarR family transcriptional regulator
MVISQAWIQVLTRMAELDKKPRDYGSGDLLHHAEIHTIMMIGKNPDITITSLGSILGISTSAASQMITRLTKKGLVERFKRKDNEKEICLKLTSPGTIAYYGHEQHHAIIYARMEKKLGEMTDEGYEYLLRFLRAMADTAEEILNEE